MSTFVSFQPSTQAAFSFQATIANQAYTITITWNLAGQRYYLNIADLSQTPILSLPLVPTGPSISAQFTWALGIATAITQVPHNVPIGQCANVYVSQTETVFDGSVQMLSTGPYTLTYQLPTDPNESNPITGSVNFSLNLVQSYISGGYFLYQYESQQFEFG